jgi:hypothetical protein
MSSARATSGFKTKGSRAEIVTPTEFSGSNTLQKYDQGVYVNDISTLIDPATVRMRPNNDFLKIKRGIAVQITEGSFDDTESPSSFVSSEISFVTASIVTSSYVPYAAALDVLSLGGAGPSITSIGAGVYDITGSTDAGYAYVKGQFLSASTVELQYDFNTSDDSDDDWPFYAVSSVEPIGAPTVPSPGLLFNPPPAVSSETGQVVVQIPAGNWLSFGIRSAGSLGGAGETRFAITQLVTGTFERVTPVLPSSFIPISFFESSHPQGGKGSGYTVAPSHFQLDNDFGQPDTYQDGTLFEETATEIDPIVVVETDPADLFVPFHVVNAADQTSMDGLIDVQDTRKKIERDLEIPFPLRGTWGDLGQSDTYRRSPLLEDQAEVLAVRLKGDGTAFFGTDAFLDAGDEFGLADILGVDPDLLSSGSKSPEGYVKAPEESVTPYVEKNDRELVFDAVSSVGDIEMGSVALTLSGSRYFPTHDHLGRNYVSLSHGFDYDSSITGIDSLAFGGLLR